MANIQNPEDILVLTKSGVTTLSTGILNACNSRIIKRITNEITSGDLKHVPSSDAVHNALEEIRQISIETIVQLIIPSGDIHEAEIIPNNHTLYMVRTSALAKTATPYIWVNEEVGFISGSPEAVHYIPLDTDDINECVAAAVEATEPDI